MESIIKEICNIRSEEYAELGALQDNRYAVSVKNSDGSKTAYYFSVPIYDRHTGRLLESRFEKLGERIYLLGSDCCVSAGRDLILSGDDGDIRINMPSYPKQISGGCIRYEGAQIFPTLNGVAYRGELDENGELFLNLSLDKSLRPKCNGKYFALMRDKLRAAFTVSGICATDSEGTRIFSVHIDHETRGETEYVLRIRANDGRATSVFFEINLFGEKLILDTTVESANAKQNNAYGSAAFIGRTKAFGEQWLYSRPNMAQMKELRKSYIQSVHLYLPMIAPTEERIAVFGIESRFCSIGSNWINRKKSTQSFARSEVCGKYQSIDVTDILAPRGRISKQSDGMIFKSVGSSFAAVSTADSFYAPQILAIKYR